MPENRTIEAAIAAGTTAIIAWMLGGSFALLASLMCLFLTAALLPLFQRYALARPNARSSHVTPKPQGGGAAVVLSVIAIVLLLPFLGAKTGGGLMMPLLAATLLLAVIGALDDIIQLSVLPRLGGQIMAVVMVVLGSSSGGSLFPILPYGMEVALLVLAGAWFVNLTNFVDGIDGITLAGFLPLAAGAALLGHSGVLSADGWLLAVIFFGALAGFVFFNYPRAQIFLGDVGSLPIGLVGGALMLDLAQNGALAAAIILPLYHFTDATLTLILRLLRREKVWEAHRQHAYQQAVDGGWSHKRVSGIVLGLNCCLVGLALITLGKSLLVQTMIVAIAFAAVGGIILLFRSRKRLP